MKKAELEIFMFVDALGWRIVSEHNFLTGILPYRQNVEMQFGYSCAAVPTILTGEGPERHGHLSFFYLDGKSSPFKIFRYLAWLDFENSPLRRGRVRNLMSKICKKVMGFTGYFQLYSVPMARLPYFNYCEKTDIFARHGLNPVKNLADILADSGLNYFISDWRKSESDNLAEADAEISGGKLDFIFIYTAAMDAMLHNKIGDEEAINQKLNFYQNAINTILAGAEEKYEKVHFTLISDHGMTPLAGVVDLKKIVEGDSPYHFGRDFAVCYDSTMMRIWYFKEGARKFIEKRLKDADTPGHWLTAAELEYYKINFRDKKYGEEFFLMEPGFQIAPSDMGNQALNGMHGFLPSDIDSQAAILSNSPFEIPIRHVSNYFDLMKLRIENLKKKKKEQNI